MRAAPFIVVLSTLAAMAWAGGLSEKELAAARKLNVTKCAKCHKLYEPTNYTEQAWDDWMAKMSDKGKLKPAQAELLARYFETVRTEARGSATNSLARR